MFINIINYIKLIIFYYTQGKYFFLPLPHLVYKKRILDKLRTLKSDLFFLSMVYKSVFMQMRKAFVSFFFQFWVIFKKWKYFNLEKQDIYISFSYYVVFDLLRNVTLKAFSN